MEYAAVTVATLAAAPLALLAQHLAGQMIVSERSEWAFQGQQIRRVHHQPQTLLIGAFLALALGAAAWRLGFGLQLLLAVAFIVGLVVLASVDFQILILPDAGTQPLLWLGLIAGGAGVFLAPAEAILGATTGYALIWLVHHLGRMLPSSSGMGMGDAKLLAAIGAWTGHLAAIQTLALAMGAMALVGLVARRHRGDALPLGPGLAAAGIAIFVWAPT